MGSLDASSLRAALAAGVQSLLQESASSGAAGVDAVAERLGDLRSP